MKGRIPAFDFTRVLCTFGIILFHFSLNTASEFRPLGVFCNGVWGDIFVGIFFILSGGLLFVNNRDTSPAVFYYKRWKSIYPPFYIAYILCFVLTVFRDHDSLLKPLHYYIPTILGMDGLVNIFNLSSRFPTVYLIGEWFLGAIVICYLFMPPILWLSRKADVVLLVVFFVMAHVIKINYVSNVSEWLMYMQIGIVFFKRELWKNRYLFLLASLGAFYLSYITMPLDVRVRETFLATCLFLVMSYLGQFILQDEFLDKIFSKLSKWSFCIFLVHHIIMDNVFMLANSLYLDRAFLELMFIMAASVAGGFVLHVITSAVLKLLKKLENSSCLFGFLRV